MYTSHHKHAVEVTLHLEVYDLDVNNIDFAELLELEGDESCEVYVREYEDPQCMWQYIKCHSPSRRGCFYAV